VGGLRDRIGFGLVVLGGTLVRAVPPRAALALADAGGSLWWLVDGRRRRRARANLDAALGATHTLRERRRLERDAFRSMLRVPLEVEWFDRLLRTRRQIEARTERSGDWDAFLADVEAGRGGLLLGGHLGNWEVGGHALRVFGVPLAVVARPLDNALLQAHAMARRGGARGVIAHRGRGARLLGALREGRWLGVVIDQNAGTGGTFVPFFGMTASTEAAPLRAAQHAALPVYLGAALRRAGPLCYTLHVERLDVGPPHADRARLHAGLTELHERLEAHIRRAPGEYNWLHRRWKTRPPGEAPDARLPAYDHHRPPRAPA
jgi:KDO2-lipid IV(A) lauroyltransferase